MTSAEQQEERDIRRTAHEWRAALSLPNVPEQDLARFRSWVEADDRHEAAFDRAETLFQAMGSLDEATLGSRVMRRSRRERMALWSFSDAVGTLFSRRGAALAASVVLAAVLTLVYWDKADGIDRLAEAELVTYSTGVGELKTVTLADGSTVTLGAKSSITVALGTGRRTVGLHSGAALFDVAPDAARPFTVEAGPLKATAIGTRFDVRNNGGVTRVAVAEGEVAVSHPVVIAGNLSGMKMSASLTVGQQIAATETEGLRDIGEIPTAAIAAWQKKRLVYAGATLPELVADAKRYADIEIIVIGDSGSLRDARVTAFFDG
ncbi:MAG: FecR domain-containing protein, partial [Pseudomonadota bacterium]